MPDLGMKYREQFARNKNRKLAQIFFFYSELDKIQTIFIFQVLCWSQRTRSTKKEIFNFNFVAFGIGIEQPVVKKFPVELSSYSESLLVKKKKTKQKKTG